MMLPWLVCLPLCAAPPAGGVVVFRGLPGAAGDVTVVDPGGVAPPAVAPGLAGVTLLALDVSDRIELDGLRSDRAQLRSSLALGSYLALPAGQGSLYRYSKPGAAGVEFGLFIVDASGAARSVLTLQGAGPQSSQSPFLSRVAVSPGGDRALVITAPNVGGNLLDIDLATGAVIDRTANVGPQRFIFQGLHFGAGWGTAATAAAVWRFDGASSADAQPVPLPGVPPAWFSGEIALSSNGLWAVTTAGLDEQNADLYAFGASGAAVQVTTAPAWISPAGYLPEHLHGPYLAISDDGSRAAWRTEGLKREAFLAPVPQLQPVANHHLTSDTNYMDTIDEIGQFIFRVGTGVLVFSAGELATGGPPVIEKVDFYQADLPTAAGAPAILNLTQTNGIATPPFIVPAELDPLAVMSEPASGGLLFHSERSGGSGDLLSTTPGQIGLTTLVADVKEVTFIERAGSGLFVNLVRSSGAKNRELYRFTAPFAPSTQPLLSVDGLESFGRVAGRSDGWLGFVHAAGTRDRLWRFDPSSALLGELTNRSFFYGPTLAWAPSGELAFTVGATAVSSIFAVWPTAAAPVRLPLSNGPGFVLPGA